MKPENCKLKIMAFTVNVQYVGLNMPFRFLLLSKDFFICRCKHSVVYVALPVRFKLNHFVHMYSTAIIGEE